MSFTRLMVGFYFRKKTDNELQLYRVLHDVQTFKLVSIEELSALMDGI
ncbi:Uncharacterised protein [Moraxella caviae]|uniref:Uncharacterized protein n=1 Tax=Moraxella caviae TaxID=34060 RepID=A0A378R5X8_9GAMM|nr:hypothetical protein [Moraxella caviae]STZ09981.1 Uncharacterised protein [Moraxella caviae]